MSYTENSTEKLMERTKVVPSQEKRKTLLELRDVCFSYDGLVALRHLNLEMFAGETVVLQGPNGCGKSTLLRLVNGLIFPEEGSYLFRGKEITEKALKDKRFCKEFHQKLGFVFQNSDTQLFTGSVEEEIAFGPRQMGLSEEEVTGRVQDLSSLMGLDSLLTRAPYQLSGGEKKKVAIACILSMNPEVLVFDEPLAGLDKKSQDWLTAFLKELQKTGKTLLLSTHDDNLAQLLGTRIVTMNEDHEIASVSSL